MSLTRRDFLGSSSCLLAAGLPGSALAATAGAFFERYGYPIGLQLYTMGDIARTDLAGTLARIAAIGYRSLELAGLHGHTAAEMRAAADRAGLAIPSIHVGAQGRPGELALEGDVPATAAQLHVLGVTDVVMPMFTFPASAGGPAQGEGFPAYMQRVQPLLNREYWLQTAERLNRFGKAFKAEGLGFGYHNHNLEFAPLQEGGTGHELLLANTDPALVRFELDMGWAAAAGQDPGALIGRYKGRITQLHVKDIKPTTKVNYAMSQDPTEVGGGRLDWPRLLKVAQSAGIQRYFVEQEPPFPGDRFDSIRKSFDYLRGVSA